MLVKNYLTKEDIAFLNEIKLDSSSVEDLTLDNCLKAVEKRLEQMKEKTSLLISARNEGALLNLADLEVFTKDAERLSLIKVNIIENISMINNEVDKVLKHLASLFS